jgi:transcriptional regulator with XRE-family HTH domain
MSPLAGRSAVAGPDPALVAVLRRLRHRSGLTQEALAFQAGLTIGSMSRLERGVTDPAWSTVRAVATALDVSLEELGAAVEHEQTHHAESDTEGGGAG